MNRNFWISLLLVALASCGGGNGADDSDSADTAGGEDMSTDGEPGDEVHASARELIGINPPETPWSEMSHEDREFDMIGRFHPIFREIFSDHDAERWPDLSCDGCHGADMRERNFEMPNPSLPPIPLHGSSGYEAMESTFPEMVEFMEHEVTEPMQTMLGMGDTFTCNGCHPTPE